MSEAWIDDWLEAAYEQRTELDEADECDDEED